MDFAGKDTVAVNLLGGMFEQIAAVSQQALAGAVKGVNRNSL